MNLEQLEKGNNLLKQIEQCKKNIKGAQYSQHTECSIRETMWKINGNDISVDIPKELFRIIGKLIISEYTQKLNELEKQFNEL